MWTSVFSISVSAALFRTYLIFGPVLGVAYLEVGRGAGRLGALYGITTEGLPRRSKCFGKHSLVFSRGSSGGLVVIEVSSGRPFVREIFLACKMASLKVLLGVGIFGL